MKTCTMFEGNPTSAGHILLFWTQPDGKRRWTEGYWVSPELGWRDMAYQKVEPDSWGNPLE